MNLWMNPQQIEAMLAKAKKASREEVERILQKAESFSGLLPEEIAVLLTLQDPALLQRIFQLAHRMKEQIYGNRIVMFAPLYISDYCVNQCDYCGFQCQNQFQRRRLTQKEIAEEVQILEEMGHKRLALEAGEDPRHCDMDYIIESIHTLYGVKLKSGEIRRINVNIAATTEENYRRLKEADIGTYILFQETYHPDTYKKVHLAGPKANYHYHLTAFDRAMKAGIEDVGGGVLFGLHADYAFEVLGLMLHNQHLEETFGVGFHTISVPRMKKAEGNDLSGYYPLSDEDFLKIVAILRLAVPYTGLIISTRETPVLRKNLIRLGVSQMSGGSSVDVGGYSAKKHQESQFEMADNRSNQEVLKWIMAEGMVPSFCTACYRMGRTGDRFMQLAKTGNIKNVCLPNGLMTLYEYALDYGDSELQAQVEKLLQRELPSIQQPLAEKKTRENLKRMKEGERDLYF